MTRLARGSVTVASLIMVPAYVVLTAAIGAAYLASPVDCPNMMHGQPRAWGWLFLGLAAVMAAAFATRWRLAFCFALCCCAVTMILWAAMWRFAPNADREAATFVPILAIFVAVACVASVASLLKGEV